MEVMPILFRELDSSKGCPFHIHEKDVKDEANASKCSYGSPATKEWTNPHRGVAMVLQDC